MGWTRYRLVGKEKLLTEKLFSREFQAVFLLDFADICHNLENTKHLNNKIK